MRPVYPPMPCSYQCWFDLQCALFDHLFRNADDFTMRWIVWIGFQYRAADCYKVSAWFIFDLCPWSTVIWQRSRAFFGALYNRVVEFIVHCWCWFHRNIRCGHMVPAVLLMFCATCHICLNLLLRAVWMWLVCVGRIAGNSVHMPLMVSSVGTWKTIP